MKNIILLFLAFGLTSSSFGTKPAKATQQSAAVTKLEIVDIQKGNGPEAKAGKIVKVHYTGKLLNGKKFDSSLDRNIPFEFQLGTGAVIKGWDKGVAGMKVGGKRKLTIPSDEGYGERGFPPVIPPNSTLVFDVELLDVK